MSKNSPPFAGDGLAGLTVEQKRQLALALLEKRQRGEEVSAQPLECELSLNQQALWLQRELAPASAAYNVYAVLSAPPPFSPERFRGAVERVVGRHSALRTLYTLNDDGRPVQRVQRHAAFEWQEQDASSWALPAVRADAEAFVFSPFDLNLGPLLRVRVLDRGREGFVIALAVHHIAVDYWSFTIMIRELRQEYEVARASRRGGASNLAVTYFDFVRWQRELVASAEGAAHWEFWKRELAEPLPAVDLVLDRPRPRVQSFLGGMCRFSLSAETAQRVRQLAKGAGTTPFVVLLAAYKLLLARYSGQTDILVGTPTWGRGHARFADLVGFFVNPVVFRTQMGSDLTFGDLLLRLRGRVLEVWKHQDFPFPLLVQRLSHERIEGRPPLFQAAFALQSGGDGGADRVVQLLDSSSRSALDFGGFELEGFPIEHRRAQFELMLMMEEASDGYFGFFEYASSQFSEQSISLLCEHYVELVELAVRCPEVPFAALPAASEREMVAIRRYNETREPGLNDGDLLDAVRKQCLTAPERLAVEGLGGQLTYGGLYNRANAVADQLEALGVEREHIVAVCLPRSIDLVPVLLGIWLCGAAYLPIDPDDPMERQLRLMQLAGTNVAVVQPQAGLSNSNVVAVSPDTRRAPRKDRRGVKVLPSQLAYVIFTSGSTGEPKAVGVDHAAINNRVRWMQRQYNLEAKDRVLQKTPYTFDVSVWEFWWPLVSGATLIMAPPEAHKEPLRLAELIRQHGVTVVHFVPAMLQVFLETERLRELPLLEHVFCSGEELPPLLVARFLEQTGGTAMHNLYGPTEAAVDVSFHACTAEDGHGARVPIGHAIANVQLHVLDERLRPVGLGAPGELYIGGVGLARGYIGRPGLTAERFVPSPFDAGARLYRTGDRVRRLHGGEIDFLGRLDRQLKVRGVRIEPGEVEACLLEHPRVKEVALVARGAGARKTLECFAVAEGVATTQLLDFLRARLPAPMVPDVVHRVDALPKTSSGKLDRNALPQLAETPGERVLPRTDAERRVSEIWRDVLGLDEVGVHDDFFALGGHSLTGVQVATRLQREFHRQLSLSQLFEHRTVALLSQLLTAEAQPESSTLPQLRFAKQADVWSLSASQRRVWLAHQLGGKSAAYNVAAGIELRGGLNTLALRRALHYCFARHRNLNARVILEDAQPWAAAVATGHDFVTFQDFGTLSLKASEAASRTELQRLAQEPFELVDAPSLRVSLMRLTDEIHVMAVVAHHMFVDAWSMGTLLSEVALTYQAYCRGASAPLPAEASEMDIVAWEDELARSALVQGQLEFWKQELDGMPRALILPDTAAGIEPPGSGAGRIPFSLDAESTQRLQELCDAEGATLFMGLMAAYQVTLASFTRQLDFGVGIPVAGRPVPELESAVGMFVNMLVVRARLERAVRDRISFRELLRSVRRHSLAALEHQLVPFEQVVAAFSESGRFDRAPLFQVMLVLQNAPLHAKAFGSDLELQVVDTPTLAAKYELLLDLRKGESGLDGHLEYAQSALSAAAARQLARHLQASLRRLASSPERSAFDAPEDSRTGPSPRWSETSQNEKLSLRQRRPSQSERGASDNAPNAREHQLISIAKEVLESDSLGPEDNFFEAGGHSLMASSLLVRAQSRFGVEVPLRWFFEHPTLRQLAEYIDQHLAADFTPREAIERVDRTGPIPLSCAQERLWFLSRYAPANPFYNMGLALRLRGDLDFKALQLSLQSIVTRHEVLRTRLVQVDGRPAQQIAPPAEALITLEMSDLRLHPEAEAEALGIAEQEYRRPIDPGDFPMRARAIRVQDRVTVLTITIHHIASDGWSVGVMARELTAHYARYSAVSEPEVLPLELPELPVQYADYACWQRRALTSDKSARALDYWRSKLSGAGELLRLPCDKQPPASPSFSGGKVPIRLDPALSTRLTRLAQDGRATDYMVLLALYQVFLSRITGQRDVCVGTPVANRRRPEFEALIGFFVNAVVMRTQFDALAEGSTSFEGVLRHVRATVLEAFEHEELPFELVVDAVAAERKTSINPLFHVAFVLQNAPLPQVALPGIEYELLDIENGTTKFDLTLCLSPVGDELVGYMEYNADIFERETIEQLARQYVALARSAAADPRCAWERLPMEPHPSTLPAGSAAAAPSPSPTVCEVADWAGYHTLHELVETRARENPAAIAVTDGLRDLSYGDLLASSTALAARLQGRGIGREMIVALCIERGLDLVVAILAVLKTGAAYLPLDSTNPERRLHQILRDAQPALLLTSSSHAEFCGGQVDVMCVDGCHEVLTAETDFKLMRSASADVAYLIYTSGSTGRPKGSLITHANVLALLSACAQVFSLTPRDVWSFFHSAAFDFSVWEIFGALSNGARVVVLPYAVTRSPEETAKWLQRERVTVLSQTPSAFRQLSGRLCGDPGAFRSLRYVVFGGEALDFRSLRTWFASFGDDRPAIINMYGITETTVHVTFRHVRRSDAESSLGSLIGVPLPHFGTHVLDEALQPVPARVVGELYVSGNGVSRGYLAQPRLTAERFLPDPNGAAGQRMYRTGDLVRATGSGDMQYIGRVDQQVKLRGFRIELREIEHLLMQHPGVHAAAVRKFDIAGDACLVAYLVSDQTADAVSALRQTAKNNYLADWERLYNDTYQEGGTRDLLLNAVGWKSSYTGEDISEALMSEWRNRTVERIATLRGRAVWEIGCGTGMLTFALATGKEVYLATDVSQSAVDIVAETCEQLELPNVQVEPRRADDFAGIPGRAYDLVILNSVVQYFPDEAYLSDVLNGAIAATSDGGHIFIGDVRSLPLLEAFHLSVIQHREPSLPVERALREARRAAAAEEELVVDPAMFLQLQGRNERVVGVELLLKRGAASTEMGRFRYDVILHIAQPGAPRGGIAPSEVLLWQGAATLSELKDKLHKGVESVALTHIPNARVAVEQGLLTGRRTHSQELVDPEELWAAGSAHGYEVWIRPQVAGEPQLMDAAFARLDRPRLRQAWYTEAPVEALRTPRANVPVDAQLSHALTLDVREFVASQLPGYMVPSSFVHLTTLPLTINGKLDVAALPVPAELRRDVDTPYRAPETPMEHLLAALCGELLGLTRVGADDDFFALGGHSLMATQLAARVEQQTGLALPLKVIFDAKSIAPIARSLELSRPALQLPPIEGSPPGSSAPLSFAQERMRFLQLLDPQGHAYNIVAAFELIGRVNVEAFRTALARVVARHEVLRSRFPATTSSTVAFDDELSDSLVVEPLELDADLREVVRERAGHIARRPFDLENGPLLRVVLYTAGEGRAAVMVCLHHIIADGWSVGILERELAETYAASLAGRPPKLPNLSIRYGDYARWQREIAGGDSSAYLLKYWKRQLHGAPAQTCLPLDRARPLVQSFVGRTLFQRIGERETRALRDAAQREGVTLHMLLLGALYLTVQSYTGQQDLVIGTPVANRTRAETESLVGLFVNTLALRVQIDTRATLRDFLQQVRRISLDAYAHQELPFDTLVTALDLPRDVAATPLFQILFVLQNAPTSELDLEGLAVREIELEQTSSKFDLTVEAREVDSGVELKIEYADALFNERTASAFVGAYKYWVQTLSAGLNVALRACPRGPDLPPGLGLVTQGSRHEHGFCSIYERFASHAESRGGELAIGTAQSRLTYAQTAHRARRFASALAHLGVRRGDIVAVCLGRHEDLPVSLLAIWHLGAVFVPLDPTYPLARNALMVRQSGAQFILADDGVSLGDTEGARLITPANLSDELNAREAGKVSLLPTETAYIMYTSGSSGTPKGVAVSHANLANLMDWARQAFSSAERASVLAATSIAFDVSMLELLLPLSTGGQVVMMRDHLALLEQDPPSPVALLAGVPAIVELLVAKGRIPHSVATVVLAGEQCLPQTVNALLGLPHISRVVNAYGPTEATVYATAKELLAPAVGMPAIGVPIAGTSAYVLDDALRPAPPGGLGQLYIGGNGVAIGYSGRAALTAERFVPDPWSQEPGAKMYATGDVVRLNSSSELEFIGRNDDQVKVRGVRVELAEVEAALKRQPLVLDATVIAQSEPSGTVELVGYVVVDPRFDESTALSGLRSELPGAFVPAQLVAVGMLPRLPNGKLDRSSLPKPAAQQRKIAAHVAPDTDLERELVQLWQELLGISDVGTTDSFFDLGGHSILAVQGRVLVREKFGVDVPLTEFFLSPTVRQLARLIERELMTGVDDAELEQLLQEEL